MRIPVAIALCLCTAVSACERERAKSPAELLAEDTTLAIDLARANDALGGEPDTLIGLVDDEPPVANAPRAPEIHIEHATPDPGTSRSAVEPRAAAPPASVSAPPRQTVPASRPAESPVIASGPGCDSPTTADQRRCLLALLARYDVGLNAAYREVIQRMRRDAGTGAGDPDPASVRELRASQRSWLVYRDRECRRRTRSREGQLWAPIRARCLGQLSGERAAELRAM